MQYSTSSNSKKIHHNEPIQCDIRDEVGSARIHIE